MGLDRTGFKRKNFAELKDEIETLAKEQYGHDINLSLKSPFGMVFWVFAWFLSKVWELAEKVYHSGHPTEAEGVQLDYLTPFYNTSRNPEQSALVSLTFTGRASYTIPEGVRYETESGIGFELSEDVTLDLSGNGSGLAYALTAGTVGNVEPGTITVQSEPNTDVYTVTNTEAAEGGVEEETDTELINRLMKSNSSNGAGTPNAILSAVLGVEGVRSAYPTINNTDAPINGQPEHSVQVYVLGGEGQDVAEAIFSKVAGGIDTYGTNEYFVNDLSGNSHTVYFTSASAVPIFVSVSLTTDNTFPADGATQAENKVIETISGLNMGDDVIRFQIEKAVGQVQGVVDVTVTIGKDAATLSSSNIVIEQNEIAETNAANVTVTV